MNLSPSGDWNGYTFARYREGMAPLRVERFISNTGPSTSAAYSIGFSLELTEDPGQKLELGVSAVLAHKGGGRSYFALHHGGERPDFHRRDGFLLRL